MDEGLVKVKLTKNIGKTDKLLKTVQVGTWNIRNDTEVTVYKQKDTEGTGRQYKRDLVSKAETSLRRCDIAVELKIHH